MALETFYQVLKDIWANGILQRIRQQRTQRRIAHIASTSRSPAAISYLEWKYSSYAPYFLRLGSVCYPVLAFPAPPNQIDAPDSVLKDPEPDYDPTDRAPTSDQFTISDSTCRRLWAQAGRPLEDRPTYTMLSLNFIDGESLSMQCGMGTYFQSLDTCESLDWELAEALHGRARSDAAISDEAELKRLDSRLPLRTTLHSSVELPVEDGTGRSVAIGGECAVAFNRKGRISILLAERSARGVAWHDSLLDVVPGYMFQPIAAQRQEYSIDFNVYREFAEEMFDVEEDASCHPEILYKLPAVAKVKEMERNKSAKLYLTGIGITLANLRPEVCTLLLIKDEHWYDWYVGNRKLNPEFWNRCREVDICSSSDYMVDKAAILEAEGKRLHPNRISPPGAVAFWLAVDLLSRLGTDRPSPKPDPLHEAT